MLVHKVRGNGYRWGRQGKVYRGKGAKAKALKQAHVVRMTTEDNR